MAIRIKAWLSPWCTWRGEVSLLLSLVLIAILAGQEVLPDELYQDLDDAVQEENTETHSCHQRQLVLPRLPCLVNNDEHFIGRQTYYPSRHWIRGQNPYTLDQNFGGMPSPLPHNFTAGGGLPLPVGQIIYSLFLNLSSPF